MLGIHYDRDEAASEDARVRREYVSNAGTLMDGSHTNCCGEADAYEADDFEQDAEGNTIAILTCNDPDNCKEIRGKDIRAPGTKIVIPPERVLANYKPVNNTGHGWVWLRPGTLDVDVYCYAAPGGV